MAVFTTYTIYSSWLVAFTNVTALERNQIEILHGKRMDSRRKRKTFSKSNPISIQYWLLDFCSELLTHYFFDCCYQPRLACESQHRYQIAFDNENFEENGNKKEIQQIWLPKTVAKFMRIYWNLCSNHRAITALKFDLFKITISFFALFLLDQLKKKNT